MVSHNMVTTQFELDGYRVTRTLGVVRGIVVRSRSIFGTIGAGLQTLVGGNITLNSAATPSSEPAMTRPKSCRASRKCWPTEQLFSWNP
jgi:uncharacterized protein YbjQ (UPF0145 family)